jgi:membrane protein YqaA with SNARE-associated domain
MRSLFNSLLSYFLTPGGLLLMGALDSSVVFFLPLGIDFVVIILTARKPELFWMYAVLAAVGSIAGASLTFWIGRKMGEAGLTRLLKPSTLKRVEQRVSNSSAYLVAALGIIPPPFPFTAFLLTSGALRVNPWQFLSALAGVRLVRFFLEAALAAHYGRGILAWMQSPTFTAAVIGLTVLAGIGTIISAISVLRSAKKSRSGTAEGRPLRQTRPAARDLR